MSENSGKKNPEFPSLSKLKAAITELVQKFKQENDTQERRRGTHHRQREDRRSWTNGEIVNRGHQMLESKSEKMWCSAYERERQRDFEVQTNEEDWEENPMALVRLHGRERSLQGRRLVFQEGKRRLHSGGTLKKW